MAGRSGGQQRVSVVVCIALVFVRYMLSPLGNSSPAIESPRGLMLLVMVVCVAILALRTVALVAAALYVGELP